MVFVFVAAYELPNLRRQFLWGNSPELSLILQERSSDSFLNITEGSEVFKAFSLSYDFLNSGNFSYGASFWNATLNQFLPSSLLGSSFKNSLRFDTHIDRILREDNYHSLYFYVAPMGFAESVAELGILAPIIFFVLGNYISRLESKAYEFRSAVLLYSTLPYVAIAVSNDIYTLPGKIIFVSIACLVIPRK